MISLVIVPIAAVALVLLGSLIGRRLRRPAGPSTLVWDPRLGRWVPANRQQPDL